MKNIQKSIERIPQDRIAFVDSTQQYTYEDLAHLKSLNHKTIMELRGSSVAINGRGRLEFALLLSLLDSHVASILFLPQDIDPNYHSSFYEKSNVHYEVFLNNDAIGYTTVKKNLDQNSSKDYSTKWIIPTSGTTNIPKLVSHTFSSLTKSTKFNPEYGIHFNWGLVFDIYRFSGIQVLLQSLLSGSTLIITESHQSMPEILQLLVEKNCNALSATPSFWRKVLMTKISDELQLKQITLGGEIADQNILQALRQKYPYAKISHIYASTEVGVGFSVTDCLEGFPKEYLTGNLQDIKMKIHNDLLWIAPHNKDQTYIAHGKIYDKNGYINTGDLVELKGDRVYFRGRDSGAINVGGNKVQPEEVERTLLSSGFVHAAYVYPMKNPMMGALVCADIVLAQADKDKHKAKLEILKYCRERLEGFKVPAIIKFVDELQTTQSGKLQRKKL